MTTTSHELVALRPLPILVGGLSALLATVLTVQLGLAAGTVVAAACMLLAQARAWARPALLALPAVLAQAAPAPERWPEPPPGPVRLCGVVGHVQDEPAGITFTLGNGQRWLRVHADGLVDLRPGDRITALARVAAPALTDGKSGVHVPRGGLHIERPAPSIPALATALRRALQHELLHRLPGSPGVLLSTLVLNQGPPLPAEVASAHRATGLAHLLAVSGSHAAVLALLLGLAPGARIGPRHGRARRLTALAILGLYGLITGLEAPVFRAVCAFTIAAVARAHHRRAGLLLTLLGPAVLTAFLAPHDLQSRGFALSYAAVFGLWCAESGQQTPTERWLLGPLRASLWAALCTAPLTLLWFGQLAPWTVLLTPLLAPLVGVLLLGGLLCAVFGTCAPLLADLLAWPLAPLADLYANTVVAADSLPATPLHATATPTPGLLLLAALVAIAGLAFRPGRAGVALACTVMSAVHFLPARAPQPRCELFALGHGQCLLAELTDGTQVMVDCGSLDHPSLAARKAATALRTRTIDLLVLTHGDSDHIDAVPALLEQCSVRLCCLPDDLLSSPLAAWLTAHGVALRGLAPGEQVPFRPDVQLVRPPPPGGNNPGNDGGLWARLTLGAHSLLIAGDPEERGIQAAFAAGILQPASVLVLPHHGRSNKHLDQLLATVRPQLCLVSNRAGEGRSAQGDAVAAHGIEVLATGDCGDLQLRLQDGVLRAQTALGQGLRSP